MDQLQYKRDNIDQAFGALKVLSKLVDERYNNVNFSGKVGSLRSIYLLDSDKNDEKLVNKNIKNTITELKDIAGEIEHHVSQYGGVSGEDLKQFRQIISQFYDCTENASFGPAGRPTEEARLMELGKLEGRLRDLQERELNISESINKLQARVEKYESEKKQYFESLKGSLEEAMRENQRELAKSVDSINELYTEESAKLNQKSQDIDVLISVIGGKAISGGFIKNAVEEKKVADYFRGAAILAMLGMAGFLWHSLDSNGSSLLDPSAVALKIGFAVFSSFVVAYLAKQSALHRSQQHKYQQKAFDLSGINTYIATLPASDQHALKVKIAEKIFVPPETLMAIEASGFGANELLGKLIDKLEIPAKTKTTP
ncbi:MAG: hypothetical protein ACN6PP_00635 [Delftia tsuruhatensis]